jgi:hypothetical protein
MAPPDGSYLNPQEAIGFLHLVVFLGYVSSMDAKIWAERIRGLPFLDFLANAWEGDHYKIMAKLREDYEAKHEVYVWSIEHKRPAARCHTGEHEILPISHEIVRPGGGGQARLLITERELHDLEHHGRKLVDAQIKKLEAIFEG